MLMYKSLNWILFNKFLYKISLKIRQSLITNGIKWNEFFCHMICQPSQSVLEITCLRGWFGKLTENSEIAKVKRGQFQKFWKFIPKIAQTKWTVSLFIQNFECSKQ